ncbi:MAG: hypothetical protein FJ293_12975 [Planctomycetes bacterium]|nr:hypothetical protein [Planctomycetota bacterium]
MKDGANAKADRTAKAGTAKPAAAKDAAKASTGAAKGGSANKAGSAAKGGSANKAGNANKTGAASGKGAGADKAAPPPAPVRRIQVMQVSTLKPGAKGSRMQVARIDGPAGSEAGAKAASESGAKKRRSAELTRQQIDHFRELLLQRRERLTVDLNLMQDEALKVTAQDNSSDSVADTGTDNYEQDFTLGLIESEEGLAREVDEALLRIDQDAYGVCESCQIPIPLARLEILPFARTCVECQQKRESQG